MILQNDTKLKDTPPLESQHNEAPIHASQPEASQESLPESLQDSTQEAASTRNPAVSVGPSELDAQEQRPLSQAEIAAREKEMERIRAREKEANKSPEDIELFESEMLPHIKSLYHFAFRLTNNEDDSNDLVQDTFLKAYRFLSSYERGSNAKAWLFRILKNSFINNYRKASKEPNKVDYEEAENYLNTGKSTYSDSIDLRDKLFRGLIGDEVSRALNSLPVDFRTVIILCDIEEFTYEEIAKIVDIPIGTVRSRLHRARKMLREMLMEYAVRLGYNTD